MRCVLAGLLVGFALLPAAGRAENTAVHACDLAAARPAAGTEMVGPQAVAACQAALAADPENPRLLFEMGRVAQSNNDDNQARAFYERAAAHGYASAQNNLGLFYASGRGGLAKSDKEAARLFGLAAAQGDANSETDIGFFYETGRGGLPKSDREAVRFYKLAADQGNVTAEDRLGAFYATGRGGLPKNEKEVARICKLVADQDQASTGSNWIDAFRVRLSKCWYPPTGVDAKSNVRVTLRVQFNSDGLLSQTPRVIGVDPPSSPLGAALTKSALKALELAQPFTMLKAENYNRWKDMELVFDPKTLLRQ